MMVNSQQVQATRIKRKVKDAKRAKSLKLVLLMISWISKTGLDLRRNFLIKFLLSFPRLVMIGCLNLSLKREKVLVHQARHQLVESVARSTMVIALLERTIVMW